MDGIAGRSTDLFSFIAYEHDSEVTLAHGASAFEALDFADQIAPRASVKILYVGDIGLKIWFERMTFGQAVAARKQADRPHAPRRHARTGPSAEAAITPTTRPTHPVDLVSSGA